MYALPLKSCRHMSRKQWVTDTSSSIRGSELSVLSERILYASSLHESRCFITSRARGFRTPSSIYFQPMKQTRADILSLHSADRPGPFHQHGMVSAMSSSMAILFEGDGDTGIEEPVLQNSLTSWIVIVMTPRRRSEGSTMEVVDRFNYKSIKWPQSRTLFCISCRCSVFVELPSE